MTPIRPTGRRRARRPVVAASLGLATVALSGCGVFSQPRPAPAGGSSLAPAGAVGYVVCPNAVTPVELASRTAEAPIALPVSGTPDLGDFAIATSPDGRWAYVVTADGTISAAPTSPTTTAPPGGTAAATSTPTSTVPSTAPATTTAPAAAAPGPVSTIGVQNVVIPINLVTQRAGRPIDIPGQGATHAIVVLPGGHTVLATSGSTIVPVDVDHRRVGRPLDLGAGRTIFGLALNPVAPAVYALVGGGVVPVDTSNATVGATVATGLTVSSVYSPHGIAVTDDGATVYVVGQGPPDFGGRVLPIATATGTPGTAASFDNYGIADPAALAVEPDGSSLLVADSANNWINPLPVASFTDPPSRSGSRPRPPVSPARAPSTPPTSSSARREAVPTWWWDSIPSCPTIRRPRPSAGPFRCAPGPRRWPWRRPPDLDPGSAVRGDVDPRCPYGIDGVRRPVDGRALAGGL